MIDFDSSKWRMLHYHTITRVIDFPKCAVSVFIGSTRVNLPTPLSGWLKLTLNAYNRKLSASLRFRLGWYKFLISLLMTMIDIKCEWNCIAQIPREHMVTSGRFQFEVQSECERETVNKPKLKSMKSSNKQRIRRTCSDSTVEFLSVAKWTSGSGCHYRCVYVR